MILRRTCLIAPLSMPNFSVSRLIRYDRLLYGRIYRPATNVPHARPEAIQRLFSKPLPSLSAFRQQPPLYGPISRAMLSELRRPDLKMATPPEKVRRALELSVLAVSFSNSARLASLPVDEDLITDTAELLGTVGPALISQAYPPASQRMMWTTFTPWLQATSLPAYQRADLWQLLMTHLSSDTSASAAEAQEHCASK